MKEYTVNLGGRDYRLAYGPRDAIALKRRFGKPFVNLLREDVMGLVERPKPEGKPGETQWLPEATWDLEVQAAFIATGIAGPDGTGQKIGEDKVLTLIGEHFKAGRNMGELIEPTWKAVFASGTVGAVIDTEKATEEEAQPEGKA